MKILSFISMVMLISFFLLLDNSCRKDTSDIISKSVYTIAVLSDIHYMDPSLLPDTGSSVMIYLKSGASYEVVR